MTEPVYEAVWPLGRSTGTAVELSGAVGAEGPRRVGFVWDYVFRGDEMFDVLREELSARYPGVEFVPYEAFGNMHGHDEREQLAALPDRLRAERVDAAVVGVGA